MLSLKNILVVDDDDINLFIIKKIIEKSPFEINLTTKKDGLEALNYLKNLMKNNQKLPDILITDINMPVMNGWDLIENSVALGLLNHTNLYVLTSSVFEEDLEKSKKHPNLNGFISKPLTFDILSKLMEDLKA
jgi:CheY-like chemotaxis protein